MGPHATEWVPTDALLQLAENDTDCQNKPIHLPRPVTEMQQVFTILLTLHVIVLSANW